MEMDIDNAGIEQNPGPVYMYIYRYQYLLVKLGTDVQRRVFDVVVGNNVVEYLNAKSRDIQRLIKVRMITADQSQLLPPINSQPDSSKFDITLLFCLLRNICGLRQPRDCVWIKPAITDTSVEADITRLRMCRNQLAHSYTLVISEAEFIAKWEELSQILMRLNTVAGIQDLSTLIDHAKHMHFGREIGQRYEHGIDARQHLDQTITGRGQSIFWYRHIVTDIGTIVLRQLFDGKVGRDFWTNSYINTDRGNRFHLMNSLSVDQKKLLPPLEKHPNSSKFDLTLLTNLLRCVCGLCPPTDPVWWNPETTDFSIEADITRFNNYTHKMVHGHTFLPETELKRRIVDVTMILQRLGIENRDLSNTIVCAQSLPLDEVVPDDYIIRGNISSQPLEPEIPEKSLVRLTSLSLYGIKMEHNSLKEMVKHLSSNTRIENINLSYVSCDYHQDSDTDCTLTLSLQNKIKLTSVCLYGVNIVCDGVNCFTLQYIKLYPISKRIVGSYINVFNCIKGSHLERLDIYGSLARYDDNTLKSLTSAVKTLKHIKSLKLSGINLPNDVSFQLHPDVTHVAIVLKYVTMSRECFQSFTSNCVEAISEAHVELDRCTIIPTEDSHLKSWQNTARYMSANFSDKPAVQVTYQNECCLHFKRTVQ